MRRLFSYGFGLLIFLLAACNREEAQDNEWDGPVIEFQLNCEDGPVSKAGADGDQEGVNAYRENLISWVDFYFYPDGVTTSNATYHIRKENVNARSNASFSLVLTTNQVNYLIFPVLTETTTTTVLALANVPSDLLDAEEDTSMDHLLSLQTSTNFVTDNYRQDRFIMFGKTDIHLNGRSKKVVSSGNTIDLSRLACKITVGIKVDDQVKYDTKRKDDESGDPIYEYWRPSVEEMRIYLDGGVKNAMLGGKAIADSDDDNLLPSYFSYRSKPLYFYQNTGTPADPVYSQIFDKTGDYFNTYPMYTYPHHWEDGVADENANNNEPFLKLVLPWERLRDDAHNIRAAKKDFYYKILIPKDRRGAAFIDRFISNNWYHYEVEVGMLGAETEDAAIDVTPSFYIYYWQDKDIVVKHASIGTARYLSVEEEYKVEDENNPANLKFYEINNLNTLDVRYTSSNPVKYEVLSVVRPYFGSTVPNPESTEETEREPRVLGAILRRAGDGVNDWALKDLKKGELYLDYAYETSESGQISTKDWFQDTGASITFTHQLNNDYTTTNFDYSPYYIFLKISHADGGAGDEYAKIVKIIQYPGIYIKAELNSDPKVYDPAQGLPIAGDETENASGAVWRNYAHNGYVFVDGQRRWRHKTNKSDDGEYGTVARHLYSGWTVNSTYEHIRQNLEWLQWRTVNFTGGNRNMYNITVTVLPEAIKVGKTTFDFVIGDPRTLEPEIWNNGREYQAAAKRYTTAPYAYYDYYPYYNYKDGVENKAYEVQFQKAPDITGGDPRELTWYYPAEATDRTKNMLAPELRVASRFGGLEFYNGVTFPSAQFKCATYQEDGYPAGRWRLPTMAEIVFIATLSTKGGFIKLFSDDRNYWSANGAIKPNSGPQGSADFALVRCVYDAWYWDQIPHENGKDIRRLPEGDRDRYVFGDRMR